MIERIIPAVLLILAMLVALVGSIVRARRGEASSGKVTGADAAFLSVSAIVGVVAIVLSLAR